MKKGPYLGPCSGGKWFQLARRRAKKKIFFAQCNDQHTVHKLLRYQAKNIATDTGDFSLSNKNLGEIVTTFSLPPCYEPVIKLYPLWFVKSLFSICCFFNIPTFSNHYFELKERPSFADTHLMYLLKRNNLKNVI